MCLPSILEIADQAGLTANPRTLGKKRVEYKCPFCLGDSNKNSKYKMILHAEENVYKCWLCGEKGGVLQFESKLLNIPYEEVKKKYFKGRNYHPAELLSPKQLNLISWAEAKRRNRAGFLGSLDSVLEDWKDYEREQLIYTYAKFVIIAQLPESKSLSLLTGLTETCAESGIKNLLSRVIEQYTAEEKAEWVEESLLYARAAWKVTLLTADINHETTLANLAYFIHCSKKFNGISLKWEKSQQAAN